MTNRQGRNGFTLIEAAVAIAVVAILSGIIVPLVVKNLGDSQRARAMNDIQVIAAAIASQVKDTGGRPRAAGGPGGAAGAAQQTWQSAGAAGAGATLTGGANTFVDLFTAPSGALTAAQGNALFGTTVGNEFSYRGPYLGSDVALKSDPWGSAYMILGYNANSQGVNGPIWVVSAGPNRAVTAANFTVTTNAYPTVWAIGAGTPSADDIFVRVN